MVDLLFVIVIKTVVPFCMSCVECLGLVDAVDVQVEGGFD
jgi:hypothetical protein